MSEFKLLRFHAPWCAPCKAMAPMVAKVTSELNLPVDNIDIDTEEGTIIAGRFSIRSVPTLVLVKNDRETSEEVYRRSGLTNSTVLESELRIALGESV